MENTNFKIKYTPNVLEKFKTLSETRQVLLKEKLTEKEIYLYNFPEIFPVSEYRNDLRKFIIDIYKNDWYVFLYFIDKKEKIILISEFYHFKEDFLIN